MVNLYVVPKFFFGYDIALELAFAVISLLVVYFSFQIYKLTTHPHLKLFGLSFLFISLSYMAQSLINFAILSELNEDVCIALKISDVNLLNAVGIFIHMVMFLTGLVLLTYMTLRVKNVSTYYLMLIISVLGLLFSTRKLFFFYLIVSILLLYITIFYTKNYYKKRHRGNLLVMIAFAFLFMSHIHFVFSLSNGLFYMLGHILELIAYLFILTNLILLKK